VSQPRTTVDRVLQELHALRLVDVEDAPLGDRGWRYFLAADTDAATLALLVTRNVSRQAYPLASPHGEAEEEERKESKEASDRASSHISGDGSANGQTVFDFAESLLSDISDAACEYCGLDLNAFQVADGVTIHPDCAEVAKLEGESS
jgi:hypothetical protein